MGIFDLCSRESSFEHADFKLVRIDHSAGGGGVCVYDAHFGLEGAFGAGGDMARQELSPKIVTNVT